MRGYQTNYVNLIADNLRDRYESGFPILKELIQNADDAGARTLIFGSHAGFPTTPHPLLYGPGLWFFNDGEFKKSDADALRSFGINSKAGDAGVIGKFGLGMKSVFHLCEALFYVAWDGMDFHCEGLTPWKHDGHSTHPEWDETSPADWDALKSLGLDMVNTPGQSWFLLWLPLRMRRHLQNRSREETGAIISRFPGDDPSSELAFLHDSELPRDVAEMLPLLRHLERVEYRADTNPFVLELSPGPRLIGDLPCERADGQVSKGGKETLLAFSGLRSASADRWFASAKDREEWPRIWYRDELGHEHLAIDKALPEAAVLFCAGFDSVPIGRLHWAVFLPVEDGAQRIKSEGCKLRHSIVLHGQFFLDAGRKNVHGLQDLHREPADVGHARIDENTLRTAWNQKLAQDVLLPLVLPALDRYTDKLKLSTDECGHLTAAISDTDWFRRFKTHICGKSCWVRSLQRGTEPKWNLVEGDARYRLRPLPKPPNSAPERPWAVFPELATSNVLPYDAGAPSLWDQPRQWQEAELVHLLSRIGGLFTDGPSMDYLAEFLETWARPYLSTERIQNRLLSVLRDGLRAAGLQARRQVTAKGSRLVGFLGPESRLELSAELPEAILKELWGVDAPILLIPRGMDDSARSSEGSPDESTLVGWLDVLNRALDAKVDMPIQRQVLAAVQGLLRTLAAEARGRFLRVNRTLRVIGVRDATTGDEKAVSFEYVEQIRTAGTLFGYAEGLGEAAMGLTPLLARAIPDAEVCLVRAQTYRELFPDDGASVRGQRIPSAADGKACLAAIGRQTTGRLGDIGDRQRVLEHANDPATDLNALRGLRLLLHGSIEHRGEDSAALWIGRHDQHPAWNRLWASIHKDEQWSLIPEELADSIPRARWTQANIAEIDSRNLLEELRRSDCIDIEGLEEFSIEERNEILSRVEDADLWRRLPLHTTVAGEPVTATGESVYLAPGQRRRDEPLALRAVLIAPSDNTGVAQQQKSWLRPFDDRAIIEIALSSEDPVLHWRSVMAALHAIPGDVGENLQRLIRSEPWLPTVYGMPVKPEDVIDLKASLGDETHRLVAEHRAAYGPCFAVPDEIDGDLRDHAAWHRIRELGFASEHEALKRLGSLLEDLPAYHIGEWRENPKGDEIKLLARCDSLPGWRLLEMASAGPFAPDVLWDQLAPPLARPIDAARLAEALEWLSADTTQWNVRKSVYDNYLIQLAQDRENARRFVPGLRLASRDNTWNDAAALCAGAHGVTESRVLDARQVGILGDLVYKAGAADTRETAGGIPDAAFRTARDAAPEVLREYFRDWHSSLVPAPMIGVVLGMLGPGVRDLANEYLYPHSFDWLAGRLPWRDPGRTPERREWMGDKTAAEALDLIELGVRIEPSDEVEVLNLLGQPIRVALAQEIKTLLAGALSWQGGYGVMVPFRRVEPGRFEAEQLLELLGATAERLYIELYNQATTDLGSLWRELDRSDQLEIGIARRLILDHIPFYLRQLSVKSKRIEQQLAKCDSWRRRVAEAEADGDSGESIRRELRESLEALARCIDENKDEQSAVVQAVKSKLRQYQYDLSSIPFELFQNGDDAAVELGYFHAYPLEGCDIPPAARRFVVDEREDSTAFLHWGRPINARGPVGFRGERLGYDRDLEKMLILSATDKRGDEESTGKFGLGFKCVLLACEQPRIVSGRLAARVVSGILPQPWEDSRGARQRITELGPDSRLPGTLIDLPGVHAELRNQVLARFRQLAGILCVFGRAVRNITTVSASESGWSWQPSEIVPGIEVGQLDLRGEWGSQTAALCIRTESGSLLMALGPQGFRPLPDDIPSIWVTAPTREASSVGFAVNGRFDLDAGRARLAGSTTENFEKAGRIGSAAGDVLQSLLERSFANWPPVRTVLGLADGFDGLAFWESIWFGLTKQWLRRRRSDGTDLTRAVALGVLARLSQRPKAVPNGLMGPLRAFADAGEIRYELGGGLLQKDVAAKLGVWARFTSRYPAQICVSKEIGDILREAKVANPQLLSLSALVGLLDHARVDPDDAEVLGWLRLLTEETLDWESEDLQRRLSQLEFRSEAGDWVEARKLLANRGAGLDPDEPRRHRLAPANFRLHPDYCGRTGDELPGMVFFLAVRRRLEAPSQTIAKWVLDAASPKTRREALEYLADGELGEPVAERVRGKGWLQTALQEPELTRDLSEGQVDRLRRRLISIARLEWAVHAEEQWEDRGSIYAGVDLETALVRLRDWWSTEGAEKAAEYRSRIFPHDLNLVPDPQSGRINRSSWLTLLAIASFQGMGRARDAQHRSFVRYCQYRGWWGVFTESDPREEPDKWMNIIEEYAEAQHDDEEWTLWLAQFPKLYRLRRWLDDYVELFLSIERFTDRFTLDTILAPRANPEFQGGGIDAPPLTRTLKVGSHLVVRELLHRRVITNPLAIPHAYAPIDRIRAFFAAFDVAVDSAEDVYTILEKHLGERDAVFDGDYDIPLRIVSTDQLLLQKLLG